MNKLHRRKNIANNYLNVVEAARVAKDKSEAAPKSAPRGRVRGEHAAWARTAYDALKEKYEPGADKAIDAAKKHRPGFPLGRVAKTKYRFFAF